VPAACHEVKFVSEISVETRGVKMDREIGERDVENYGRAGGEARANGSAADVPPTKLRPSVARDPKQFS